MPRFRRTAFATASAALVGYGGATGYLKLNETELVFHPAGRVVEAPSPEFALREERVTFRTADSTRIAAWVIPAAAPAPADSTGIWLLVCHGNYGNIGFGDRPRFYAMTRDLGVNLLAFDYRGFGESEGSPSERGVYADARAAYDWLREVRRVPPERIVIFGHSLGSGVATELASRVPSAGLIVEGAFTSVPDRGQELYPVMPVRIVASYRFANIEKVPTLAIPKLFLHSPTDDIIPYAHGERLFAAAAEPKRFVSVRGGHMNAFFEDSGTYFGAMREFLQMVTSGAATRP